jgi:hypothetical protein
MTQVAVPNSEISNEGTTTGWDISSGTTYGAMASLPSNAGDFVDNHIFYTFPGNETRFVECKLGLQPLVPPGAGTHTLTVWHCCPIDGDIALHNGGDDSQIKIFGLQPVGNDYGTTWRTMAENLSSEEIAAIEDYTDLYVRLYQADDGPTDLLTGAIAYVSLTVPDAPMIDLRPISDIDANAWTPTPLWSKVEETSADGTIITATAS